MKNIAVLVFFYFTSISCFAATKTWIGDSDSDWNNRFNWNGNSLPNNNDDIIIDADNYSGNNAPIISANSSFRPDIITIRDNGVLTMTGGDLDLDEDIEIESGGIFNVTGGNLDVGDDILLNDGTFSFSGNTLNVDEIEASNGSAVNLTGGTVTMTNDLDANSNSIFTIATVVTQSPSDDDDLNIGTGASFIIEDGAVITGFGDVDFDGTGGGSYIQTGGTVSLNDDFKLQDGDNNTVTISGGILNVADDFDVFTDNNIITFSGTADINITDDIDIDGGVGNNFNITGNATVDVNELVEFNGSTTNLFNISGNSQVIITDGSDGNDQDIADDFFTITQGGSLQLGSLDIILPVDLIEFMGQIEDDKVVFNWSTASEKNNDYFELLKSDDGVLFTAIGKIQGNGTSNFVHQYDYIDQHPKYGTNYYQLKQIDYDGKSELFPMVLVVYGASGEFGSHMVVWPNPVTEKKINIMIDDFNVTGTPTVSLIDLQGRVLLKEYFSPSNSISIDTSNIRINTGIYILEYHNGLERIRKRVVIN